MRVTRHRRRRRRAHLRAGVCRARRERGGARARGVSRRGRLLLVRRRHARALVRAARTRGAADRRARRGEPRLVAGAFCRAPCATARWSSPMPRDRAELQQFARRTGRFETLDGRGTRRRSSRSLPAASARRCISPRKGIWIRARRCSALVARLRAARGARSAVGTEAERTTRWPRSRRWSTARGLAARAQLLASCAACKGEMLLLRLPELSARRVRCACCTRGMPVYVVPRGAGVFMVGATMHRERRADAHQRPLACSSC